MDEPSTVAQTHPPRMDGLRGLQLLVMEPELFSIHPLPPSGVVVLGRGDAADVRVSDSHVSRRHAQLHIGRAVEIEDLAGLNGTYVRGKRLAEGERIEIGPGDAVEFGNTIVVVQPCLPRNARTSSDAWGSEHAAGRIPGHIVIADERMRRLYGLAVLAAASPINVLILGETGVGKELMAEAVHQCSSRKDGPFVCLNCATFTEALLESELFGHEKGAFTGAVRAKPGLFETAQRGTVFLDELGEMPWAVQGRLLRVIERREVMRVGAVTARPIDVRIVAATNRELAMDVQQGRFRRDLFYRLNGFTLYLPPLRERKGEVRPLAARFAEAASRTMGLTNVPRLTSAAFSKLEQHSWPGNVRELRNVIDRATLLSRGGDIDSGHIVLDEVPGGAALVGTMPGALVGAPAGSPAGENRSSISATMPSVGVGGPTVKDEMAAVERRRITEAMEMFSGNQKRAAEYLGIARRTLINRIDEYGWSRPRKSRT